MDMNDDELITPAQLANKAQKQTPPKRPLACERIIPRLKSEGISFTANDSIHQYLQPGEIENIQDDVQEAMQEVLRRLIIDTDKDHNTHDTAKRVAKMFVQEVMAGRYNAPPKLTAFPNAKEMDEIIAVGPIDIRSMCSHHMAPIVGKAWIGVIPGEKVIGLSKYNRIVDWFSRRPQIQEEHTVQIADYIEKEIKPKGLMLVIRADHFCCRWRGVEQDSQMVTSIVRGILGKNPAAKEECLALFRGMGF